MITGDFIHHPCQVACIDWCSTADHDRDQAIATRRQMFKRLAGEEVRLFGMHFNTPGVLVRDGEVYRMEAST